MQNNDIGGFIMVAVAVLVILFKILQLVVYLLQQLLNFIDYRLNHKKPTQKH